MVDLNWETGVAADAPQPVLERHDAKALRPGARGSRVVRIATPAPQPHEEAFEHLDRLVEDLAARNGAGFTQPVPESAGMETPLRALAPASVAPVARAPEAPRPADTQWPAIPERLSPLRAPFTAGLTFTLPHGAAEAAAEPAHPWPELPRGAGLALEIESWDGAQESLRVHRLEREQRALAWNESPF